MYLRPRIVLSTPHRTRPPLPLLRAPRFSSLVRLVLTCVFIRLLALFDFFIHAPSPVSTAPHKVRTSPFPSPRRARTAALHIRLHRRAQRSCALCGHLLLRQLPTSPKQRAHHAARLPASCPQRGLLAQSQDAPARFSAASRTDALLQSRRFERYGPVRRRVLARCRCTAGTRLSCRAWPGGLVA